MTAPFAPTPLTLHNTMSGEKETFVPLDPDNVRLYVCGPTVYDRAHIGNARPVVVFDVLARLLRRRFPKVTYVRNITDVDDKINARSRETGESIDAITGRTIGWYHEDMGLLNALPPDVEPRATHHIPAMIDMISTLIARGHAYEAEGHVLFSVSSMPDYGRLSRRSRDDMIAGARVEVAPYKRDPADFVLWKPSDETLPGWESPWGRGRPGWHIECSAMSSQYLGTSFDIHGGGHDLIFPHHENEIAQSVGCHGHGTFARFWLHNGHVVVDGEKMSKSLGNFLTVQDLLADAPGEVIRLALLDTHYRQPLDWTRERVARAGKTLDRFYAALERVGAVEPSFDREAAALGQAAWDRLCDDLNTPGALGELHRMVADLNRSEDPREQAALKGAILSLGGLLGLLDKDPVAWRQGAFAPAAGGVDELDAAAVEALIEERLAARKARNYGRADEIRDDLKARGIELEDGPSGTAWRKIA
ncbi:cysteine--tRNA ligase [Phaeovibrio sulfidiphilus]|uniref:Cysteine--tRNA ligase n=1 Tax=Phaeovibrio sulfidiphilus TaxID=1220600 RepID=A0A8J6YJL5_9PROT|nr:cysteine--tRNA ligase [Phaeovibrio sulfidiphilus]MBE1237566.1 cysteine--tRNA ligase [Phaeovibrio sulfidiphilus]